MLQLSNAQSHSLGYIKVTLLKSYILFRLYVFILFYRYHICLIPTVKLKNHSCRRIYKFMQPNKAEVSTKCARGFPAWSNLEYKSYTLGTSYVCLQKPIQEELHGYVTLFLKKIKCQVDVPTLLKVFFHSEMEFRIVLIILT